MKRAAILYIALGAYDVFFPLFYRSCERYFLPECERHYFVFTDVPDSPAFAGRAGVTLIPQENLGWPDNTLKRFHMFDRITDTLRAYDYIFFFNANMEFKQTVSLSALPERGLIAVQHPGYYDKPRSAFTYDENPKCAAYIPPEEGTVYVCGGVNGGSAEAYIAMYRELKRRTDADAANGVVARFHDESQLNRYIIGRSDVTVLPPDYCYPDLYRLPGHSRIIRLVWKQRYLDIYKLRGLKKTPKDRLYLLVCRLRVDWEQRFSK